MSCCVAGQGMGDCLRFLVNKAKPDDLVLRLFKNDVEPSNEPAYVEATFPGYFEIPLDGAKWAVSDGPDAVAEYGQQAFACVRTGEPEKVYGYYLTRALTPGRVAWAERFPDAPVEMANAGDTILVSPRIGCGA